MRWSVAVLAVLTALGCGDDDGVTNDAGRMDSGFDGGPVLVMPDETADDEALARLAQLAELPAFHDERYRQHTSYDRGRGGAAPLAILASGNRDLNQFLCRSADATPDDSSVVPFQFDEPTCPDAGVRGFVMARFEGSGRLARIWMTSFLELSDEVLRVYVDDDPEPRIVAPLRDAWDGTAGEIFAPPFGAGASERMAWHYPVVFSSKLVVAIDSLAELNAYYYQASAILDATPRARSAASSRLAARDLAAAALSDADGPDAPEILTDTTSSVAPGASEMLADVLGPATIRALEVRVPGASLSALENLTVEIVWDDDAAAAVALPLDELFAAGLAPPDPSSPALASHVEGDQQVLTLRLPMPFASHAVVSVSNAGTTAVDVSLSLAGDRTEPTAPYGLLHAIRSETLPADGRDRHPIADVAGPGRLAGVCFMLEGHALESLGGLSSGAFNFLEGDERGVVDGEAVLIGTGTEDYLSSAFYFREGPFATPFAQAWDIETDDSAPEGGRVSACRWHVLGDTIDFTTSLALDVEIGPNAPEILDRYRTVAFVYR